jgi:hypothetical protein
VAASRGPPRARTMMMPRRPTRRAGKRAGVHTSAGQLVEHDPLPRTGERRADAAPDGAAERQPRAGGWAGTQEPVHPPGRRLRVDVRATVQEQGAGSDRARRQLSPGDRRGRPQPPKRTQWHGRVQPQGLGDRGVGHAGLAGGQPGLRLRVGGDLCERPAQGGGGRLVSRDEQGEQLIAQLAVRQRNAVVGSRSHEQREDVGPLAEVGQLTANYHTDHDRVVVHVPTTGVPGKTHEADVDRMPVCIMRGFFERVLLDPAERDLVTHLGPGTVTCGHCANARRS